MSQSAACLLHKRVTHSLRACLPSHQDPLTGLPGVKDTTASRSASGVAGQSPEGAPADPDASTASTTERDRLGVAGVTAPDDIQSNTGLEFALVLRPDLDASAFGSSFRRKPESSFTDTSKSWIPAFAGMTNIFLVMGRFARSEVGTLGIFRFHD